MPFHKGQPRPPTSGRKRGSHNKAHGEVHTVARSILEHPQYQDNLLRRALAGELPPAMEILLYHYAYGKPVDVSRNDQLFIEDLIAVVWQQVTSAEGHRAIRAVVDAHACGAPLHLPPPGRNGR
jgi:hypothetical protein